MTLRRIIICINMITHNYNVVISIVNIIIIIVIHYDYVVSGFLHHGARLHHDFIFITRFGFHYKINAVSRLQTFGHFILLVIIFVQNNAFVLYHNDTVTVRVFV